MTQKDYDSYRLKSIAHTNRWGGVSPESIAHSLRWRAVSTRYPRRVAEAYHGDITRALRESDAAVAATVAAWEHAHGLRPRDWYAIGRCEREESPRPVRVRR